MRINTKVKRLLLGMVGVLAICGATLFVQPSFGSASKGTHFDAEEEFDSPDKAHEWRMLAWRDEDGNIPHDGLARASEQIQKLSSRTVRNLGNGWQERGPNNVAGRTRSLLIDPRDPNKMFMGSVSGGIWLTTNGGANWYPINDRLPNLAINCMAFDPSNPDTIYAGTGEGFYGFASVNGAGIYKSTDGGTTWDILPASTSLGNINRIAVSPTDSNVLLVAVQSPGTLTRGIHRSIDGGASFTQVKSVSVGYQVAFHPTDGNRAFATCRDLNPATGQWTAKGMHSTDGGVTWNDAIGTRITGGEREEFTYSKQTPGRILMFASYQGGKVLKSDDYGATFSIVTTSNLAENQFWHDLAIWVSPTNDQNVVVAAVRVWRSTDGGVTFTQISNGGGPLTETPHSDVHAIVAHPGFDGATNSTVFVGTDGGFYKTDNILTATPSSGWSRFTRDARTSQFYGAVGHGPSGRIIGGTQDNCTLRFEPGSQEGIIQATGDGGFCGIDPTDGNMVYGELPFLAIFRFVGNNGWMIANSDIKIGELSSPSVNFIAPFILDPNNEQRILAGGTQLWRTNNAKAEPGNMVSWSSIKPSIGSPISAIAVAKGNSDIVWVGHNNGQIFKTTNGTSPNPTWTPVDNNALVNPLPDRYIGRILVDPGNSEKVFVGIGGFEANNLQVTVDGGTSWTSASGSGATALPAAPIRAIARHPSDANILHVGTEVGVCESADGGATWSAPNKGPLNVCVHELNYMTDSNRLIAATYGRGIWTYGPIVVQSLSAPSHVTAGETAQVVVTVDGIAGAGGVDVSLSSSNAALSTPSSVNVPAGQTQATFTVAANSVATSTAVTLSAILNGETKSTVITVDPVPASTLASASVTPSIVPGGSSKVVKFKVALQKPAPAGGLNVSLFSSNPGVAGMPSSVTIAAGTSSRLVTVSHASVPIDTSVTLTAKYNSEASSATLVVEAPKPFSVVNVPTSVVGGSATTVNTTLTLNAPAPAGGAVIELSSSNAAAAVPTVSSVTVAEGTTSANFTVGHFPVAALKNVSIRATANGLTRSGALAVKPAALQSLTILPTTVIGGGVVAVTGTVKINAPAPATGAKVLLSDDSDAAAAPASVTIPSGATEATFAITHSSVPVNTVVTLTGVYNATKSDTLTLIPPRLKALTLNRSTVVGGTATVVTGTVTLNAKAPGGGTVVTLSSSEPSAASVPTSVTVPAGATSATFTVTHSKVVSQVVVTLTASGGGATFTKTLTIKP